MYKFQDNYLFNFFRIFLLTNCAGCGIMKITIAWAVGARPKLLLYHILLDLSIGKNEQKNEGIFSPHSLLLDIPLDAIMFDDARQDTLDPRELVPGDTLASVLADDGFALVQS